MYQVQTVVLLLLYCTSITTAALFCSVACYCIERYWCTELLRYCRVPGTVLAVCTINTILFFTVLMYRTHLHYCTVLYCTVPRCTVPLKYCTTLYVMHIDKSSLRFIVSTSVSFDYVCYLSAPYKFASPPGFGSTLIPKGNLLIYTPKYIYIIQGSTSGCWRREIPGVTHIEKGHEGNTTVLVVTAYIYVGGDMGYTFHEEQLAIKRANNSLWITQDKCCDRP